MPHPSARRPKFGVEPLERRDTPAFTSMALGFGQLSMIGDAADDDLIITVGRTGSSGTISCSPT